MIAYAAHAKVRIFRTYFRPNVFSLCFGRRYFLVVECHLNLKYDGFAGILSTGVTAIMLSYTIPSLLRFCGE